VVGILPVGTLQPIYRPRISLRYIEPERRVGVNPAGKVWRAGRVAADTTDEEATVADEDVLSSINQLANEEHDLFQKEARGEASDGDRERMKALEVSLDQCWDLLHQRRARRSAGMDPNQAEVRPESVVEGYVQ
jgi:hypothetical protein